MIHRCTHKEPLLTRFCFRGPGVVSHENSRMPIFTYLIIFVRIVDQLMMVIFIFLFFFLFRKLGIWQTCNEMRSFGSIVSLSIPCIISISCWNSSLSLSSSASRFCNLDAEFSWDTTPGPWKQNLVRSGSLCVHRCLMWISVGYNFELVANRRGNGCMWTGMRYQLIGIPKSTEYSSAGFIGNSASIEYT